MNKTPMLFILLGAITTATAVAKTVTFSSPNGLSEVCRALPAIPEGDYSKGDFKDEQLLCSLDFYDTTAIALCPKTWSTSPGTMVYDISASGLAQIDYEAQRSCGGSKDGHEKITKFKQTMHQSGTSGTFAPASLLYYHFSRYFDTSVDVPVAVYRSMDKDVHFERVTKRAHENRMGKGDMNRAGWKWLYNAEREPTVYKPTSELFTDDNRQIYGVLGEGGGERYGPEINGIRSKWGDAQNYDFQETPAFIALRSEKPLPEAIAEGLAEGQKNKAIRRAMGGGASNFQMAIWMIELSEIVLLDYIFSQQDRIGNIDYKWYIYWLDAEGKVKSDKLKTEVARAKMDSIEYPREVDGSPTWLVQRTRLNDNDAAGKPQYVNYAKRTKMLERLRHMRKKTFERLLALDEDFRAQGPLYQYLKNEFYLSEAQVDMIVSNTASAAATVRANYDAGKLRLCVRCSSTFLHAASRRPGAGPGRTLGAQ